jgi:hypothetical protein
MLLKEHMKYETFELKRLKLVITHYYIFFYVVKVSNYKVKLVDTDV